MTTMPYLVTTTTCAPVSAASTLPFVHTRAASSKRAEPRSERELSSQPETFPMRESRRAVATLEDPADAIRHLRPTMPGALWLELVDRIRNLPRSGGTITLPDGTVVEVEQIAWADLVTQTGLDYPEINARYAQAEPRGNTAGQIIAAHNAAQEGVKT